MEEKRNVLVSTCSFRDVKPIMMDLPYPQLQVREKNRTYANLLSNDYAGAVSEMTAITQYISDESRLFCEDCMLAKTILGIAMAEMIHLQKLGEMIFLLGAILIFRQGKGMEEAECGRRSTWLSRKMQGRCCLLISKRKGQPSISIKHI